MRFYTKWCITPVDSEGISCQQKIEKIGDNHHLFNTFRFFAVENERFSLELTNDIIGPIQGSGLIDTKTIAWEFRGSREFEGFEAYHLQENGEYLFHAEYYSLDQFRTTIDGKIWKKS